MPPLDKKTIDQILINNGYDPDYLSDDILGFKWTYSICRKGNLELLQAFLTLFPDWLYYQDAEHGNVVNSVVEGGDLEKLKYVLNLGAPFNLKDKSGDTPLQTAINWKQERLVIHLLKYGANPTNLNNKKTSILTKVIQNKWDKVYALLFEKGVKIQTEDLFQLVIDCKKATKYDAYFYLEELLKRGGNPNVVNDEESLIFFTTMAEQPKVINLLIQYGAKVTWKNKYGWNISMLAQYYNIEAIQAVLEKHGVPKADITPYQIIKAAEEGNTNAIERYISQGKDLEIKNYNGLTLLYKTIAKGKYETAKLLLKAGANPNIVFKKTNTPLVFIAGNKKKSFVQRKEMIVLLLKAGAIPNESTHGSRAFILSVLNNDYEIANLLFQAGADINSIDNRNQDLLLHAIARNDTKMFDFLVAKKINIDGARGLGKYDLLSPLMFAVEKYHLDLINKLLALGADPNLTDKSGKTALMIAVEQKDDKKVVSLIEVLLKAGAKVELRNNYGRDAIDLAKSYLAKTLLRHALTWDCLDYEYLVANLSFKQFNDWIGSGTPYALTKIIAAGFDINHVPEEEIPPIIQTLQLGYSDIYGWLNANGANPDLPKKYFDQLKENRRLELQYRLTSYEADLADKSAFDIKINLLTAHRSNVCLEEMPINYSGLVKGMTLTQFNTWISIFSLPTFFLERILQEGFNLNAIKPNEMPPLVAAAKANNSSIFHLLLDYGADPHIVGNSNGVLGEATRLDIDCMQRVVAAGVNIHQMVSGYIPLTVAAASGTLENMEWLLSIGADPNFLKAGYSPLFRAVQRKDIEKVKLLLEYGADVNCKSPLDKKSVLDFANEQSNKDFATLLSKYVQPNAKDAAGRTPLFKASIRGDENQIINLLNRRAEVEIIDSTGQSLKSFASRRMSAAKLIGVPYEPLPIKNVFPVLSSTLLHLLKHRTLPENFKTNPNEVDYRGDSLLHYAIAFNKLKEIERLLEMGADIQLKNKLGETPLIYALAFGKESVKEFFKSKNISLFDDNMDAINQQATIYGRIEAFEKVFVKGDIAQINTHLNDLSVNINMLRVTTTPLQLAIKYRDLDMFQFLLNKGAAIEVSGHHEESLLDKVLIQAIWGQKENRTFYRDFIEAKMKQEEAKLQTLSKEVTQYLYQVQKEASPRNLYLDFQIIQQLMKQSDRISSTILSNTPESNTQWSLKKLGELILDIAK